jgi:Patatin-like phospholipase
MSLRAVPSLFLFCILLSASVSAPQQVVDRAPTARPKLGIVLEGGGALGLAHIGVLEWMEENRIPVSYVAGTSMGGLVGGIYATGKSPAEVKEITNGIDRSHTRRLWCGPLFSSMVLTLTTCFSALEHDSHLSISAATGPSCAAMQSSARNIC